MEERNVRIMGHSLVMAKMKSRGWRGGEFYSMMPVMNELFRTEDCWHFSLSGHWGWELKSFDVKMGALISPRRTGECALSISSAALKVPYGPTSSARGAWRNGALCAIVNWELRAPLKTSSTSEQEVVMTMPEEVGYSTTTILQPACELLRAQMQW